MATLGEDLACGRLAAGVQAVGDERESSSVLERRDDPSVPPVTSNIWGWRGGCGGTKTLVNKTIVRARKEY